MKNLKYHAFGTVPKYNRKIAERDKTDIFNPQIHFLSLSQTWDRHFNKKWRDETSFMCTITA
jgi:hypothetical protein